MSNMLTAVRLINDALITINTVQPLIAMAVAEGRDISNDELAAASARLSSEIEKLKQTIADVKS